ncbi:protein DETOXIFICATION 30-like isoform X2 [Phragmites australis]|uniref:protein DETOXIFICATION 30-like isoform X2 n=1 Tax=Phragmites australis TaxID=29695 RepID=UPI002D78C1C9|nr:protein DETOXIFICATION 30-like isoform X2 [Phragmites australis]
MMMKRLVSKSWEESRRLWHVAFPVILTEVFQFSIGFVTTGFVGHLGEVELAAVTVVENILENFAFGVLFGMGSALDTLCGQAVGAGQLDMLGIYTQQSWIVCGATALALTPAYAFTAPILKSLLRQPPDVSDVAGPYARWAIPRLFAHAMNYPLLKFFQTQSKVWPVTAISGVSLAVHVVLTYVAVRRLEYGLRGAAVAGNISHWLIVAAQFVYMVRGRFPDAWKGFSIRAFKNLAAFVKLSLVSAVMICLEVWYYTALLILVGLLKNAKLQLDIMSVCINYEFWTMMVALGFSTAISVRVSNELGANRPKDAQFAVVVAVSTSAFIGAIFLAIFFIWRTSLPKLFSDSEEVVQGASRLGYVLAVTVFLSSIWPLLSGVAVGSGLQVFVAFINVGCYYLVGIPLGVLFGFKLKLGPLGIWMGMLTGTLLQIVILLFIIVRMKWERQAMLAEARITEWGGKNEDHEMMSSTNTSGQIATANGEAYVQASQKNRELVCTD